MAKKKFRWNPFWGMVCDLGLNEPGEMAQVLMMGEPDQTRRRVRISRLKAAGANYVGARFVLWVGTNGSTRKTKIKVDKRQKSKDRKRHREAVAKLQLLE